MSDQTSLSPSVLKALIRTFMPAVYSGVAAAIAHFGYHVSLATVIQIVGGGFAGLTVVLHWAEKKYPWVGALLGWIGVPQYAPSVKATQASEIAALQAEIAALKGTA